MKIKTLSQLCLVASFLVTAPVFADHQRSDKSINSEVISKIAHDNALKSSPIKVGVDTQEGVVSFSGIVQSDSQASSLIEIADSTLGVKDVDTSKLKVKDSKQPFSDLVITAKVKGTFIREKLFGDKKVPDISVETNNGVVYLTGEADSREQVNTAVKLAKNVSGVQQVNYRIKLTKGEIINYP